MRSHGSKTQYSPHILVFIPWYQMDHWTWSKQNMVGICVNSMTFGGSLDVIKAHCCIDTGGDLTCVGVWLLGGQIVSIHSYSVSHKLTQVNNWGWVVGVCWGWGGWGWGWGWGVGGYSMCHKICTQVWLLISSVPSGFMGLIYLSMLFIVASLAMGWFSDYFTFFTGMLYNILRKWYFLMQMLWM